jgi:hypothetical protein
LGAKDVDFKAGVVILAEHKTAEKTGKSRIIYLSPEAEETTDIEHHEFLISVGVPEEWRDDPDWWGGWTAEIVRTGVRIIAEDGGMTEGELIEKAVRESDRSAAAETRKVMQLESQLAHQAEAISDAERVARGRALLLPADTIDKVMRYEARLNRQLMQTLHQLERLQAIRAGNPPAPPAVLDVTVEAGGLALDAAG